MTKTTATTTSNTGHSLLDSETNEALSTDDLYCTAEEYSEYVLDSLASEQAEGHIRVNGRRVYAQ